jgi:hypothetical protein
MSDLLAIFSGAEDDADIMAGIASYRPDRVTVLVTGTDSELTADDSSQAEVVRDRLAVLMATIEHRTGATVVGVAGDRTQLAGWRFDRELGAREPVAA